MGELFIVLLISVLLFGYIPDTLVKLMEYGEDDDDSEETDEELHTGNSVAVTARKPFWAL